MPELIGVITLPLPVHLKKYALLFDRFTSPNLILPLFSWSLTEKGSWSAYELEWLIEQGIVFDPGLADEVESADGGLKEVYESHLAALSVARKELNSFNKSMNLRWLESMKSSASFDSEESRKMLKMMFAEMFKCLSPPGQWL